MRTRMFVNLAGNDIVFVIETIDRDGFYFEFFNSIKGKTESRMLDKSEIKFELQDYLYLGNFTEEAA